MCMCARAFVCMLNGASWCLCVVATSFQVTMQINTIQVKRTHVYNEIKKKTAKRNETKRKTARIHNKQSNTMVNQMKMKRCYVCVCVQVSRSDRQKVKWKRQPDIAETLEFRVPISSRKSKYVIIVRVLASVYAHFSFDGVQVRLLCMHISLPFYPLSLTLLFFDLIFAPPLPILILISIVRSCSLFAILFLSCFDHLYQQLYLHHFQIGAFTFPVAKIYLHV